MIDTEIIIEDWEEHASQIVAVREGFLEEETHNLNFEGGK